MSSTTSAGVAISKLGAAQAMDGRRFEFTPAIFADIVASYDPELRPAPLVIGHPKLDDPAYGWVKSLNFDGKHLNAEPHQVEPAFAELVNTGRFPNRSMSIYLPESPGNPKPGHYYPKHVGFLGAAPPAIAGLPAAKLDAAHFAADDGAVEFAVPLAYMGNTIADLFQRIREWLIERDGVEKADAIIPQWQIRSISESADDTASSPAFAAPGGPSSETNTMSKDTQAADFAQRTSQLDTREAGIKAREEAIAKAEAAARRNAVVEFVGQLVKDGRLVPAEKDGIVELLVVIDTSEALSFAEAGTEVTKKPADILRGFLQGLPARIEFRERSGADNASGAVEFAAAPGSTVDPVRMELHRKALAYQHDHPNTAYIDAVRAVGG